MTHVCIAHGGDISTPSGGTDRVSAFAAGLVNRGHDVTLVVPELDGTRQHTLDGVDIVEITLPSAIENSVSRAGTIARRARQIAVECDATLQYEHSIMAGLGTLTGASSYVLDMHDLAYARYDHVDSALAPVLKRGVAWLERRAVTRADQIVVVSEYMKTELQTTWGVPESKISVIPNGFFPEKLKGFEETNLIEGRACFLGTLHPKVDTGAIEQVAGLQEVEEVIVIGDGAQREYLERLEREYSELKVTGRLPDEEAFEKLASAAVAINPQESSALQRSSSPVKLYYYAALGKPMVVTEGPPIVSDLVAANAAIGAESREEFVNGVARVLTDPELAASLRGNALKQAEQFRWDSRVDALSRVYE